jgi:hypothetical protein
MRCIESALQAVEGTFDQFSRHPRNHAVAAKIRSVGLLARKSVTDACGLTKTIMLEF